MAKRHFDTAVAVIDAAGGTTKFAKWFGVKRSRASMWRNRKKFPPNTYEAMRPRLKKEFGIDAPPSVWGQLETTGAGNGRAKHRAQ